MNKIKYWPSLLSVFVLFVFSTTNVEAQSVRLNWSDDGSRFWHTGTNADNKLEFYAVDAVKRTRDVAFDQQRVREAFTKMLGKDFEVTKLPFTRIAFTESPGQLLLIGGKQTWTLNLDSYEIKETEPRKFSKLFLPPRRSGPQGERTNIVLVNHLDEDFELVWLASDGRTRSYGHVAAGEEKDMSTYVGHTWLLKTRSGKVLGCYESEPDGRIVISKKTVEAVARKDGNSTSERRRNRASTSATSPDKKWTVIIRDHDLWLRKNAEAASGTNTDDEEKALADDANEKNSFRRAGRSNSNSRNGSADVRWTPDSRFLIAYQTAEVTVPRVHYIESSPSDQLQPKLQSYAYPKPGDPMAKKTLRLFSVSDQKEIPVSNELFKTPYETRFLQWSDSGDRFWLLYNQRGHQVLRLVEVNTTDGKVRVIAEEKSETFIQYSDRGKNYHRFLVNDELLWASERSGWNHLYRYDMKTGNVINPVTSGNWNVKRIEKVDEEQKQIWFYAVGVVPEQDPYHEHFCRVDFDGSNFKVLTSGDGTHRIKFEQGETYFFDTWSRVDLAPITVLRESKNGELVCELKKEDAADSFQDRRLTERFVSPGRDGKTEIWGIVHFPRDFDPEKKYPVVENIYAGPHDHHVPKSFRSRYGAHRIADAGMIVVQIDGMGTAWRSKEFHDVCYKNLRDAGFPDRIAWMKAAAKKFPQMDLGRVGIYGGSAGGQNAMAALLWHNDFYKVAVADCGCHDNRMDKRWWNEQWMGYPVDESYSENSNMENAHLLQGNLMLLVGEMDRNVDPASTTQVVNKLIKANKEFEFVLVTGTGHGSASSPWASRKRLNFLKTHLGVDD